MRQGDAGAPGGAMLALAASLWGFLLPLSFLARLESLSLHLSPWELAQAYGTAWLAHAPLALGLGALAALVAAQAPWARLRRAIPAAALIGGFLFAAALGLRDQFTAFAPEAPASALALAAGSGAIGLLLGLWRPEIAAPARPVALALAALGAPLALLALGVGLAQQHDAAPPPPPPAPAGRPDILLITLDALSAEHMSAYGYARPTTPEFDAFARSGVRFDQMVASSNFTPPTLASLMTGQHPWRHGATILKARVAPDAAAQSLPARLRAGGYAVRAVTTNAYGGVWKLGLGQHFDTVATDRMPLLLSCREAASRWLPLACPATDIGLTATIRGRATRLRGMLGAWGPGRHFDARIALGDAERLLRRPSDGRPVFVWTHLMPPHDPFAAPPPFLGRFDASPRRRGWRDSSPIYLFGFAAQSADHALLRARYDESIAAVDADLGAFLGRLRRTGRLANTIVIISADHGELFRPDYGGHAGPALYQPVLHIPLAVAGPGVAAGRVLEETVSQVDLAPTILALAGAGPAPPGWDGRSLAPALRGQPLSPRPALAAALERASRFTAPAAGSLAVIDGRWKAVRVWGQPDQTGYRSLRGGLFDLGTDPEEAHDRTSDQPARATAMQALLDRAIPGSGPRGPR